jgi:Mg/Co/Ni transporter MgtE
MEELMNPFVWRREHQIALILGAILGAVVVVVIGFMYRGLNYGWISSALFWSSSTARWAILGALIGGSIVYVQRLLQI